MATTFDVIDFKMEHLNNKSSSFFFVVTAGH